MADEIKEDRWQRFMTKAQSISCTKLQNKVGNKYDVIVDSVSKELAICRTMSDAPEIDGNLFIDKENQILKTR